MALRLSCVLFALEPRWWVLLRDTNSKLLDPGDNEGHRGTEITRIVYLLRVSKG